jgi:transcriptional regulator with XRE-family HTH domain
LKCLKKRPLDSKPDGLAGHLQHRRHTLGLTRKAAAALIGVRGAAVGQWEAGHQPEPQCWPAIIRFLGLDPVCPDPKSIPEKIAYLCRHRGLSKSLLGGLVGVDKATITNWERGARPQNRATATLDRLVEEIRNAARI